MSTRTIPTAEDWVYFSSQLDDSYFGRVELKIDGFSVTYFRSLISKNTLGISSYVNGLFKGSWTKADPPCEEARRFWRLITRNLYSPKQKALMKRACGKKESERTYSYYSPFWRSSKSLKRHLLKVNQEIVILRRPVFDPPSA